MEDKKIPLDWLVCPVTKEALKQKNDTLYSSFGEFKKNSEYGFYDFVPYELDELRSERWQIWDRLQVSGLISYEKDPCNNLVVGERKDALEFMRFCDFRGNILDVGCGPQATPTHMAYCSKKDVFFVGIDPLVGDQPRSFAFVLGLGEYLPFRDELFHQVLLVTSLDHFIDPIVPLKEARRVLRNDGEICVWIGEKDKDAPKRSESHEWYKALEIPEGAEDQFHFKRIAGFEFESYSKKSNLKLHKKEVHIIDNHRRNLFYQLVK